MKIQNAIAFVTGANRGLGLAFARALLARGASKVYAGMRNPDGIDIPGIIPVRLDVTDPASVAAAAKQCADTTLLVNNAGIARVLPSTLDPQVIELAREMFETNYYGLVRVSQAFAPIVQANGGGAIVNVLSDSTWLARPLLSPYSSSKAAAWAFTNAMRAELRGQNVLVQGIHVGFLDTDMTKGFDMSKTSPASVVAQSLDGVEQELEEILADQGTVALKASLSGSQPQYLFQPDIA
jgi:NAD(P)-dependent dehydrogenase (short-subunit alcohol dehydrogenase family)